MRFLSKRIAVIAENSSDILKILSSNVEVVVFRPGEIYINSLEDFHSICILGGTSEEPIMLGARERKMVEDQIRSGKKVFAEYCGSISSVYYENPVSTRYERLVFCSKDNKVKDIETGEILDDQCGMRIKPHAQFCSHNAPILQYVNVHAHKKINSVDEVAKEISDRALWFEKDNLMICSFRLSNFITARYAPKNKMRSLVKYILQWLTDENIDTSVIKDYYEIKDINSKEELKDRLKKASEEAMAWFRKCGIIINEGKDGVYEGFGTEVYGDGSQRFAKLIRTDCAGEVSLAFFMDYMMNGNKESIEISNNLSSFIFDHMQVKEEGPCKGMIRWTQQAWETCYQDDVARAINGHMLKCLYTNSQAYLEECKEALDFMINTTGTDGTRVFRTDILELDEEKINELKNNPGKFPSAHYNAYYHASLLIAYKLTGVERYKEIAIKGLTTIMEAYPETVREQSQTEEYCRLILPLSWLYWVTGEEMHKQWLYKVAEDLQQFKHITGAYLEWDEGYKATMRNTKGDGECSLLAENGDTVVDLLYSNNWLPMGFMQAYLVTGDEYFKNLWIENIKFMLEIQINSKDDKINGAWARGFDVEYMEYFGSPADVGWGPWAIESGWTVAEITSGIFMGILEDKLKEFY